VNDTSTGHLNGLELDVVIIGSGFGGLYALQRVRDQMGMRVESFDDAAGVGGTWYWNRYPGCRVDTESTVYAYSFDREMFLEWEWPERYARQPAVLEYLNAVADKHDLKRSINFETRIVRAEWDEAVRRWQLTTSRGDKLSARYVIEGVGLLSSSYVPQFPLREKFRGEVYLASKWPHEEPQLAGKRVGVVGTGSTGIQIITEVADEVEHLYVFQRTPQWCVPLGLGPFPVATRQRIKEDPAGYVNWALNTGTVFGFEESTVPAASVSDEERERVYEAAWQKGNGFEFMLGTFADIVGSAEANATATEFIRNKIHSIVRDPNTAELLTPADYYAKRPLAADHYYETYNRENVTLVDVKSAPITGFSERGLVTADAEYELDVVILATGFDAVTGNYLKIETTGRDGVTLQEKWGDGPHAFCGMTIAGFPNLFMIFGPFGPFTSQPLVHEWQVNWFTELMRAADERGMVVDTDERAEAEWVAMCQEQMAGTLFAVTDSWINGANVPGKPRASMFYMNGMVNYMAEMDAIKDASYKGFVFG
jgi:cation diffusion facilitator CzcD-associated flavoprotein CzcO